MTALLSLFSGFKTLQWIFFGVACIAAFAGGGYLGYVTDNRLEENRITAITKQNSADAAKSLQQIATLSNNLAVCRDTLDKQDKAITAQNKAASDLQAVANAAAKRAQAALAEADAHRREAQELSVALAASRPDAPSYASLVTLIQEGE